MWLEAAGMSSLISLVYSSLFSLSRRLPTLNIHILYEHVVHDPVYDEITTVTPSFILFVLKCPYKLLNVWKTHTNWLLLFLFIHHKACASENRKWEYFKGIHQEFTSSQVCQNDWQNTCSTFSPLELVPYAFAWFGFGGHSKISTLRCWKFNSSITSPKTWDMLYFVGNTQIAVLGHLSIGPYSIELFAWLYCHFSYVTLYGENEKQNISP